MIKLSKEFVQYMEPGDPIHPRPVLEMSDLSYKSYTVERVKPDEDSFTIKTKEELPFYEFDSWQITANQASVLYQRISEQITKYSLLIDTNKQNMEDAQNALSILGNKIGKQDYMSQNLTTAITKVQKKPKKKKPDYTTMQLEMKEYLSACVKGQRLPILQMAVAFTNFNIILELNRKRGHKLKKDNILILGGKGQGKSYLAEKACEGSGLLFEENTLASKSGSGYVGTDIEDPLEMLVKKFMKTEGIKGVKNLQQKLDSDGIRGVIFYDELDKIAGTKFFNDQLQPELISLCHSDNYVIQIEREPINVPMNEIMFIFAGAFHGFGGVDDIRTSIAKDMGYAGNDPKRLSQALANVSPFHLENYGLDGQLLRRISNVIILNDLKNRDYRQIMRLAKGSTFEKAKLMFLERQKGLHLNFTDSAINLIARRAADPKHNTHGASFLDGVIQRLTFPIYSEEDSSLITKKAKKEKRVNITKEWVETHIDGKLPKLNTKKKKRRTERKVIEISERLNP